MFPAVDHHRDRQISHGCVARGVLVVAVSIAGLLLPTVNLAAEQGFDPETGRYLEELRRRHLFALAESYCLRRLQVIPPDSSQAAQLTVELSRTLAEHAPFAGTAEQVDLFRRADEVLAEFNRSHVDSPWRTATELQQGLNAASHAEALYWEAMLQPYNGGAADAYRQQTQQAATRLAQTVDVLSREFGRLSSAVRSPRDGPDAWQAFLWLNEAAVASVAVVVDQAEFTQQAARRRQDAPTGEAEMTSPPTALPQELPPFVNDRLEAALRTGQESLEWRSRILAVRAARLRGQVTQAERLIEQFRQTAPPLEQASRLLAEEIRLSRQTSGPVKANKLIADWVAKQGRLTGELHVLRVETLLDLWRFALDHNEVNLADELFSAAVDQVALAERDLGGLWGYRCRLILATARMTQQYGPTLGPLVQRAEASYHAGQTQEALEQFRQAAGAAQGEGRTQVAAELNFTTASLEMQQQEYAAAAEHFFAVADPGVASSRAAEAHLLAAYCLGQLYSARKTKSNREAYVAALEQHRQRFAGQQTADEAIWMQARLEEGRLQYTQALALYRELPLDFHRAAEVNAALARCYVSLLERVRQLGQPIAVWKQGATTELRSRLESPSIQSVRPNLDLIQTAVLLARIALTFAEPEPELADHWLAFALDDAAKWQAAHPDATPDQKAERQRSVTSARQLQVLSLAGQQKFESAGRLIERLTDAEPAELLAVLDGLADLAGDANAAMAAQLGEVQLRAAERLASRAGELTPEQRDRLDRCLAEAYHATQQPQRALAVYNRLLQKSPEDLELLRAVAELNDECDSPDCRQRGIDLWRKIESRLEAGSRDWLAARLEVCQSLRRLHKESDCRKLLGVTRLLYPEIEDHELRREFDQLAAELKGVDSP